jgi:hypothetical protein
LGVYVVESKQSLLESDVKGRFVWGAVLVSCDCVGEIGCMLMARKGSF